MIAQQHHWAVPAILLVLTAAAAAKPPCCTLPATAPAAAGSLDDATREAVFAALDDEWRAQASYQAVINTLGQVRPFINIVRAENMHASALLAILQKYGVKPPPNRWDPAKLKAAGTLADACKEAAEAERQNVAMYDRLLKVVKLEDVRAVMEHLRFASQEHHLPAFERHAGGNAAGMGNGPGEVRGCWRCGGYGMGWCGGRNAATQPATRPH